MTQIMLFSGGLTRIEEHGQSTGIYKKPVIGPIEVSFEGLAGDIQADRRVHGGPEKALHQYAVDNYRRLAERLPAIAAQLLVGSIGENISAAEVDESTVFIGDIFSLGRARVQVSQPRSPCWLEDRPSLRSRWRRTADRRDRPDRLVLPCARGGDDQQRRPARIDRTSAGHSFACRVVANLARAPARSGDPGTFVSGARLDAQLAEEAA